MRSIKMSPRSILTILAACASVVGCAMDPGDTNDHATASEGESLVGGTATVLFPEIGQFVRPALGKGCTATLFAPRYVITAAHCVSLNDTVQAGDAFVVTPAAGIGLSYPIDRMARFANSFYQLTPGGTMNKDIAILRLVNPVPSTVATPRALATTGPTSGTRSTIYGYGCTQRRPQSGGGFKQYFSFNFGTSTQALCPGDSGGPVVFGDWLSPGAIWGINSGFSNTGDDVFADVVYMKPRIDGQIRQWEAHDYDADGLDDVLWWNTGTGQLSVWSLDGNSHVLHDGPLSLTTTAASGWTAVGTGDFNGDGFSDVLWWSKSTGKVAVWYLAGSPYNVASGVVLDWTATASSGWKVVGTGDFNDDGIADILWHNAATGELSTWLLDGAGHVNSGLRLSQVTAESSGWKVVGTGDFDRDGHLDVLWWNGATGELSVWYLDGLGTVTSYGAISGITPASSGWSVVGTGDYDTDNNIDILWWNAATGQVSPWFLNGTQLKGYGFLDWAVPSSSGWTLVSH